MDNPKCFISYSWDSEPHKHWVRRIAEALQQNGVYVYLDQWDTKLGMDLPEYMETSIRESDYVILICTEAFAEKANKGIGGVGYEKCIVTGEIFSNSSKAKKFIPVIRSGIPSTSLPSYLKSKLFIDLTDDEKFSSGVEEILRHFFDKPFFTRPALGNKPSFQSNKVNTSRAQTERLSEDAMANPQVMKNSTAKDGLNLARLDQLKKYANSPSGLSMGWSDAINWAEKHLNDTPPLNIERLDQLKKYANSPNGLSMGWSDAINWAMANLKKGE